MLVSLLVLVWFTSWYKMQYCDYHLHQTPSLLRWQREKAKFSSPPETFDFLSLFLLRIYLFISGNRTKVMGMEYNILGTSKKDEIVEHTFMIQVPTRAAEGNRTHKIVPCTWTYFLSDFLFCTCNTRTGYENKIQNYLVLCREITDLVRVAEVCTSLLWDSFVLTNRKEAVQKIILTLDSCAIDILHRQEIAICVWKMNGVKLMMLCDKAKSHFRHTY